MSENKPDFCSVVESNLCTAPPRIGKPKVGYDSLTYARCFACGGPACVACSSRVEWFTFGMQRIGFDCLRAFDRDAEVVAHFAAEAVASAH